VQLDPEENRTLDPIAARSYLQRYFGEREIRISIYWGNAEDFARELRNRWIERHPGHAQGARS
jgi:hypothetical protein